MSCLASCGWCSATSSCLQGSILGPNSGVFCGAGHSGWGFQRASCTLQARCNQASNTDCNECTRSQSSRGACGWCESSHRCETGGVRGPTDNDCFPEATSWYYQSCSLPASVTCESYSGCLACENAPPVLNCGYCFDTDTCSPGDTSGPFPPTTCAGNTSWTFQSCQSDAICLAATSCDVCTQRSYCLWCASSQSCIPGSLQPLPGYECAGGSSALTSHWEICPGAHVIADFPLSGRIALAALVVFSALWVACSVLCGCSSKLTPVLGSRLSASGLRVSDFSHGCRRATPLLLVACSLSLKLPALILDQWDASYLTIGNELFGHIYFGYLSRREYLTHIVGGEAQTTAYASMCTTKAGYELTMCRTLRGAGIVVLSVAIVSVASSLAFLAVALVSTCRAASGGLAANSVRMWRLCSLSYLSSAACILIWSVSAHPVLILLSPAGEDLLLGVSWILQLISLLLDILLAIFMRRAVTSTPDSARGQQLQVDPFFAGAAAAGLPAVLNSGYMYLPHNQVLYEPTRGATVSGGQYGLAHQHQQVSYGNNDTSPVGSYNGGRSSQQHAGSVMSGHTLDRAEAAGAYPQYSMPAHLGQGLLQATGSMQDGVQPRTL